MSYTGHMRPLWTHNTASLTLKCKLAALRIQHLQWLHLSSAVQGPNVPFKATAITSALTVYKTAVARSNSLSCFVSSASNIDPLPLLPHSGHV